MTDEHHADRRSFLKTGAIAGTALVAGASAMAQQVAAETDASNRPLNKGDIAILRLLAAVELIESDLWLQYAELGGVQDSELPGLTGGSAAYTAALNVLDGDMSQYIHDNTEDEFSHAAFLNAYLVSKGAKPVNLDQFRTLKGSQATGANKTKLRLTNLMRLKVDTSWWTRYRSRANNPDLDPSFVFPQAVPSLFAGQFPAIPRTDADLTPQNHIQAIANTAAFHFGFIEQGGSSLYPTLAQRVTHPEVLRILLSIGPTETSHFQTWHDKAGNGVQPPAGSSDRWQSRVSEPQCTSVRRGGLPDQPDHARAVPVPQPEVPGGFDHSPDLDRDFRCSGDYKSLHGRRAVHRPNRRVL